MQTRDLYETATDFALRLERLTDAHGIARERFTVWSRRCDCSTEPDGYRVWVCLRGFDPGNRLVDFVASVHRRWQAEGWRVTDYRRLGDGGLAVGATDPDTGEEHSWETGFDVGPGRHLVGSFTTECYRDPGGAVEHGEIPLSRLSRLRGPNRRPD